MGARFLGRLRKVLSYDEQEHSGKHGGLYRHISGDSHQLHEFLVRKAPSASMVPARRLGHNELPNDETDDDANPKCESSFGYEGPTLLGPLPAS
ncbi:hypothetical protein BDV93DRAFT_525002 [Ceratobasidium sp. AG-I]|nr:hypothetical protein BDV93DRAFT_525002 [Ceratobasidium sp. AG-I]